MLRANMNFRKKSANRGSSCITRAISSLVILSATHELTAEAVAKRSPGMDATTPLQRVAGGEKCDCGLLAVLRDDVSLPGRSEERRRCCRISLGEEGLFCSNSTILRPSPAFARKAAESNALWFFGLSKYSPVLCSLPGVVDDAQEKPLAIGNDR